MGQIRPLVGESRRSPAARGVSTRESGRTLGLPGGYRRMRVREAIGGLDVLEQFADHGRGSASVDGWGAHNRAPIAHDAYAVEEAYAVGIDVEVALAPIRE